MLTSAFPSAPNPGSTAKHDRDDMDVDPEKPPLRSLASLNWPYVPEESAYPDPLKRDDPKPLQLPQYEAIGIRPHVALILARLT